MAKEKQPKRQTGFAFSKENHLILLIGVAIIAAGYLLMIGGASTDPNVFSNEIFSFRRITLAPIVIVAGFLTVLYGIIKKPKK